MTQFTHPNEYGYYGNFGGAYIPEMLHRNVEELQNNYLQIINSPAFQVEYKSLLKDYVGRPTPLYFAERLQYKNILKTRRPLPHRRTQSK
jgi:tryptophan synthase beta chain